MTLVVLLSAAMAGVTSGCLQVLPAFGASLVYQQGRYVPLWVPELAMVAAYVAHMAAPLGPALSVVVALVAAGIAGIAAHQGLFRPLIDRSKPLEALLVGIGLSQVFHGTTSLYGEGMSQHYPGMGRGAVVGALAGVPIHIVDILAFVMAILVVPALVGLMRWTHLGLQIRAVLANRDLAATSRLRVRRVDTVVIVSALVLSTGGAIIRAARFDLQPTLMSQPGLSIVAALVAAGPGRHVTAVGVAVGIEVLVAIVGSIPALSTLQEAVPFLVLGSVLLFRSAR